MVLLLLLLLLKKLLSYTSYELLDLLFSHHFLMLGVELLVFYYSITPLSIFWGGSYYEFRGIIVVLVITIALVVEGWPTMIVVILRGCIRR